MPDFLYGTTELEPRTSNLVQCISFRLPVSRMLVVLSRPVVKLVSHAILLPRHSFEHNHDISAREMISKNNLALSSHMDASSIVEKALLCLLLNLHSLMVTCCWVLPKAGPVAQQPGGPATHGPRRSGRPETPDGPVLIFHRVFFLSSGKSTCMHRSASGLGVQIG